MSTDFTGELPSYALSDLPATCHACLIYDDPKQREPILRAYLASGLRQRQFVRYFADVTPEETVRSWVEDTIPAAPDDALRVTPAETAYCPTGSFDPRAMVGAIEAGYGRAKAAGFTGSRTGAEMSWALRGIPGSERLIEYEALLNTLPTAFPHTGMCQYDSRRFDGATLFRVVRMHPYLVVGDRVVWNPEYVTPDIVLAEFGQAAS